MGIEEFLKRDTSYKVQPIPKSRGFFDSIVRGALILSEAKKEKENRCKRKAYEEGAKIGYDLAWQEFRCNLTNPNSIDLNDKEYKDLMTIITRLGYMFEYIIPNQKLDNGTAITKYAGLTVRKNIKAYENGYVVPENIKEQVVKLISKNYK